MPGKGPLDEYRERYAAALAAAAEPEGEPSVEQAPWEPLAVATPSSAAVAAALPRQSQHATPARPVDDSMASLPLSGLVALDSNVVGEKEVPTESPAEASPRAAAQLPPVTAAIAPPPPAPAPPAASTPAPRSGWFWSFVSWLTGSGTPAQALTVPPAAGRPEVSLIGSSPFPLLDKALKAQRNSPRQRAEETARQAAEDGARDLSIGDEWGRLAREDQLLEERLRGEDHSLKVEVETPQAPQTSLAGTHASGARVSGFWGALEKEDADIVSSLEDSHDLARYQQLTRMQDAQVKTAVAQIERVVPPVAGPPPLRHHDESFGVTGIHDPWSELEAKDILRETKVHQDPNLQMLQEAVRLRRQHTAAVAAA